MGGALGRGNATAPCRAQYLGRSACRRSRLRFGHRDQPWCRSTSPAASFVPQPTCLPSSAPPLHLPAQLVGELLPYAGSNAQPAAIHDAAVIACLLWPALFTPESGTDLRRHHRRPRKAAPYSRRACGWPASRFDAGCRETDLFRHIERRTLRGETVNERRGFRLHQYGCDRLSRSPAEARRDLARLELQDGPRRQGRQSGGSGEASSATTSVFIGRTGDDSFGRCGARRAHSLWRRSRAHSQRRGLGHRHRHHQGRRGRAEHDLA